MTYACKRATNVLTVIILKHLLTKLMAAFLREKISKQNSKPL
ncbi:hypothetical protein GCM10023262_16880 [Bartonella pachyuromydis]|uniref:Uncharacterized protein n=1 Tax=Bartonella pachyuromydis TaxID=931097 RepID=A0ABP8VQD9_9HYPH